MPSPHLLYYKLVIKIYIDLNKTLRFFDVILNDGQC